MLKRVITYLVRGNLRWMLPSRVCVCACARARTRVCTCVPILGGEGRATALLLGWKGIFWVDPLGQKIPFQILSCSSFAFETPESWGKGGVEPEWHALLALTPGTCDFAIVWSIFSPRPCTPCWVPVAQPSGIRVWVGQDYANLNWSSSNIFVCVPSREFYSVPLRVHYKANI